MGLQKGLALIGAIGIGPDTYLIMNCTYILEYEVLCLESLKVGLVFLSPHPLIQQRALQP